MGNVHNREVVKHAANITQKVEASQAWVMFTTGIHSNIWADIHLKHIKLKTHNTQHSHTNMSTTLDSSSMLGWPETVTKKYVFLV